MADGSVHGSAGQVLTCSLLVRRGRGMEQTVGTHLVCPVLSRSRPFLSRSSSFLSSCSSSLLSSVLRSEGGKDSSSTNPSSSSRTLKGKDPVRRRIGSLP